MGRNAPLSLGHHHYTAVASDLLLQPFVQTSPGPEASGARFAQVSIWTSPIPPVRGWACPAKRLALLICNVSLRLKIVTYL
jgi:hypothetical protein